MKTIQKTIEKTVQHPLEEHFNIEPCTTVETTTERETELIELNTYDEKDVEIEETYQEIFDKALTAYDRLQDEMEDAEAKYLARLSEVSNGLLNTALSSAQAKAKLKEHKDKLSTKKGSGGGKTVNNTLVISREELLQTLMTGAENPLDRDREVIEVTQIPDTGKTDE